MDLYIKTKTHILINKYSNFESISAHRVYIENVFRKKCELIDIILSNQIKVKEKNILENLLKSRENSFVISTINLNLTFENIRYKGRNSNTVSIIRTPIMFQQKFNENDSKINGYTIFKDTGKIITYILDRTKNKENFTFIRGNLNSDLTGYEIRDNVGEMTFKTEENLPESLISTIHYDFDGTSNQLLQILKKKYGWEFKK